MYRFTKEIYRAFDNKEFESMQECVDYEDQYNLDILKTITDSGSRIIEDTNTGDIYFYISDISLLDIFNKWSILNKIYTSDTWSETPVCFNEKTPIKTWGYLKYSNGYYLYSENNTVDHKIESLIKMKNELEKCREDRKYQLENKFKMFEIDK